MSKKNKKKEIIVYLFLLIIVLLAAEFNSSPFISKYFHKHFYKYNSENYSIVHEKNTSINVYFCPRDNCSAVLEKAILSANKSVKCSLHQLQLKNILDALKEKKKENFDVKLILDNNYKLKENLSFVKYDTSKQTTHNKFCVIDNNSVITGSFNPTYRGSSKNNNNLVVVKSKTLANNYNVEFDEMENNCFGTCKSFKKTPHEKMYLGKTEIENYFCPEDFCSQHIIENLLKAKKEIYFMVFSFTHKEIANAIIEKEKQNLVVKGVFEKRQNSKYSQFSRINKSCSQNCLFVFDKNKYTMHHKVFIIDNETVITGSMNPTKNGDNRNDENVLIIHNKTLAKEFLEEFNYVFPKATS